MDGASSQSRGLVLALGGVGCNWQGLLFKKQEMTFSHSFGVSPRVSLLGARDTAGRARSFQGGRSREGREAGLPHLAQ